jgi:hypothetical protein
MDSQCPTPEHAPAASLPRIPLQIDAVRLTTCALLPPDLVSAEKHHPNTFFRLEIEWPDSAPWRPRPNVLPLKKKRAQVHMTPQVFRPFTSFVETEFTVKSLRMMTQGRTDPLEPNTLVGEHNGSD